MAPTSATHKTVTRTKESPQYSPASKNCAERLGLRLHRSLVAATTLRCRLRFTRQAKCSNQGDSICVSGCGDMLRAGVLGAAILLQQRHQLVEHFCRDVVVALQFLVGFICHAVPFCAFFIRRLQPLWPWFASAALLAASLSFLDVASA